MTAGCSCADAMLAGADSRGADQVKPIRNPYRCKCSRQMPGPGEWTELLSTHWQQEVLTQMRAQAG